MITAEKLLHMFMRPDRRARPRWELELQGTGEPLTLPGDLQATSWGQGQPVLLVHGWEGRGTQLGAFVAPLVAAGRRAVALDGPGHGDSPGEETNIVEFAEALLKVGEVLGPLAGLVGHSFGSASGLLSAERGLRTERLVLIAGPSSILRVLNRVGSEAGLPPEGVREFIRLVEEKVGVPADSLNLRAQAPHLNCRALIFHDPADDDVPFSDSEALAAAWPAARLRPTPGLGHYRILRDPAVVAEAVAFLTESQANPPVNPVTQRA